SRTAGNVSRSNVRLNIPSSTCATSGMREHNLGTVFGGRVVDGLDELQRGDSVVDVAIDGLVTCHAACKRIQLSQVRVAGWKDRLDRLASPCDEDANHRGSEEEGIRGPNVDAPALAERVDALAPVALHVHRQLEMPNAALVQSDEAVPRVVLVPSG